MKGWLGFLGALVFAAAGLLFVNLALAHAGRTTWGVGWVVFAVLTLAGFVLAWTARGVRGVLQRLAAGTGALLCGSAVLIAVIGEHADDIGAVGVSGFANIVLLLLIGLALLAGAWYSARTR